MGDKLNRRSFLGMLAALPLIGRALVAGEPKPIPFKQPPNVGEWIKAGNRAGKSGMTEAEFNRLFDELWGQNQILPSTHSYRFDNPGRAQL